MDEPVPPKVCEICGKSPVWPLPCHRYGTTMDLCHDCKTATLDGSNPRLSDDGFPIPGPGKLVRY